MRDPDESTDRVAADRPRIPGLHRVHCSYHKCLTVYFSKVLKRVTSAPFGLTGDYRHFDSLVDDFYRDCERYTVSSINNHAIDLDRFEEIRVTRFVRDPRDLVVSGYYFHRETEESWCRVSNPTDEDWKIVNGAVPSSLANDGSGVSFRAYLNAVSIEEGLIAELEFRRRHFESMRAWPARDDRVVLFRYEDVLGREVETFDRIFRFLELPFLARRIGLNAARRLRASRATSTSDHIRDPRIGQWREVFPPSFARRFDAEYGDLIEALGYPRA